MHGIYYFISHETISTPLGSTGITFWYPYLIRECIYNLFVIKIGRIENMKCHESDQRNKRQIFEYFGGTFKITLGELL